MRSTKSSSLQYFNERPLTIYRYVNLQDRASLFSFFFSSPCMRKGAQFVPMGMPTVCWKKTVHQTNTYVVNQNLEHINDISFRSHCGCFHKIKLIPLKILKRSQKSQDRQYNGIYWDNPVYIDICLLFIGYLRKYFSLDSDNFFIIKTTRHISVLYLSILCQSDLRSCICVIRVSIC
jgi:hypothetical protein